MNLHEVAPHNKGCFGPPELHGYCQMLAGGGEEEDLVSLLFYSKAFHCFYTIFSIPLQLVNHIVVHGVKVAEG